MAIKKVDIPGIGPVQLHKRRGVRSLRLSVAHDGSVRVSLPYWLPYSAGTEYAKRQKEWITSNQHIREPLRDGLHVGKAHVLRFIPEEGRRTVNSRITTTGEIRVFYPAQIPADNPDIQRSAEKACIRALKLQAEKLLPGRLKMLADQHDFTYNTVSVKQLKSRWGSCSSERDIALNLFLMQLPWHLIDYVLLHELMHTQIMAHGTPFWSELSTYVPDLKAARKEMKTHRPALVTN